MAPLTAATPQLRESVPANDAGASVARLNGSLLQAAERPALFWLVQRLPAWTKPDHLTCVGLAGAATTLAAYLLSHWDAAFLWLASFGLFMNWFGDSLDGTLARHRRIQRDRYGFFVDHTADLFAQIMIGLGLGLSILCRFEVALIALLGYLSFFAFAHIKERSTGIMTITFMRVGPTEIRCVLVVFNAAALALPREPALVLWAPLSALDLMILGTSAASLIGLAIAAVREARRLDSETA